MAYVLPASRHYLDKQAAAVYEANTGNEIVMRQRVNATAGEAFDAWVHHIWLTGSGAQEITPGEGRGYVGHTRLIPKLQIEEQIQLVAEPVENDTAGVPSILYKVLKPGLFPIADHVALVRFMQEEDGQTGQTEIVWTIKLTPGPEGNELFASGEAVSPYLQKAVMGGLAYLATTLDEAKANKL